MTTIGYSKKCPIEKLLVFQSYITYPKNDNPGMNVKKIPIIGTIPPPLKVNDICHPFLSVQHLFNGQSCISHKLCFVFPQVALKMPSTYTQNASNSTPHPHCTMLNVLRE